MPHDTRPLLFLDVDGPLLPFGVGTKELSSGRRDYISPAALPPGANPLLTRMNPALGPQLRSLDCALVWATTWMQEANEVISPLLGLEELPVVMWPQLDEHGDADARRGLHWKTRTLITWAAGRDFAWIDDELDNTDEWHVASEHPGSALLVRIEPSQGITPRDLDHVRAWRATLGSTGAKYR